MVAQLQLPSHVKSSRCHFWATAAVAMYGLIYYSCHDLKTLGICHLLALYVWALRNLATCFVWCLRVGKTTSAYTPLFFLAAPLTRLRVGKMHNAHTTSLSHLPHGPARPA